MNLLLKPTVLVKPTLRTILDGVHYIADGQHFAKDFRIKKIKINADKFARFKK